MVQAQNNLGQLFVDIGINGGAKALKTLNTLSASFLLTKNAAQQFVRPLVNLGKQALNSAVSIGKMSTVFGTTMLEYQKLVWYFKKHKLSESLIEDLSSLQDKFTEFSLGLSAPSASMMYSLQMLGMDWTDYMDGTVESTEKFVEDVQEKVKGMDANIARLHLKNLGLNSEWLYAFQREDFNLRDARSTLDDQQIQDAIAAQEALEETMLTLQTELNKWVANNADSIRKLAVSLGDFCTSAIPVLNRLIPVIERLTTALTGRTKVQQELETPKVKELRGEDQLKATLFKYSGFNIGGTFGAKATQNGKSDTDTLWNKIHPTPAVGTPTGGAANITIENENNFYGGDVNEIKNMLGGIDYNSIMDAKYNAVQASSLGGK